MGLLDKLKLRAEGYLLSIGVKRGGMALAGVVVGFLAGPKVSAVLTQYGVNIDQAELQKGIVGGVAALAVFIHDWWRIKSRPAVKPEPDVEPPK